MNSTERDAFSVEEFCQRHGISRGTFYNDQREGLGPATMKVRGRTLVSREAAEKWRRKVERETAKAAA